MRDIESAATSELAEAMIDQKATAEDLIFDVENIDGEFDFDSYFPACHEEQEVINEYESEYYNDAQEFLHGGKAYAASDWEAARRSYASAIAYAAFSSILGEQKQKLIKAIEDFNDEVEQLMDDEPIITVSRHCIHGWASHDREDRWDGTHYWETKQLDGSNGAAIEVNGLWLSVCYTPKVEEPETEEPEVDEDKENELRASI